MKKVIIFWVGVFLVGGAAGVFANQILIPWLASFQPINKIYQGTMIVNRTEKIYIQGETAAEDALMNIAPAVVGIKTGSVQGTGLILTGDGLVVTALNLASAGDKISVLKNNESWPAKIFKKDEADNLVLLKVEKSNLPVANLAENENFKLGEKVLLSGADFIASGLTQFADSGLVRRVSPLLIQFNETGSIAGAPLINLKGQVVGINVLNKIGKTEIVLSDKIRELMK